jgi:cysteine synthase B
MSILSAIGNTPLVELAKDKIVLEPTSGNTGIVPKIYNPKMLDEKIVIEDGEALETTRMLAAKEGIFVGMSSGAAVAGAIKVAQKMSSGTIVALLPDRGDRYLSTMLFMSVCAKCPP